MPCYDREGIDIRTFFCLFLDSSQTKREECVVCECTAQMVRARSFLFIKCLAGVLLLLRVLLLVVREKKNKRLVVVQDTGNTMVDAQARYLLLHFRSLALRLAQRLESEDAAIGARMRSRLQHTVLAELDARHARRAGETVDKGSTIELCLRTRDGSKLASTTALTHVLLHELAHVACESIGHTDEFWDMERRLRRLARDEGAIDGRSTDKPVSVCGQNVSWF